MSLKEVSVSDKEPGDILRAREGEMQPRWAQDLREFPQCESVLEPKPRPEDFPPSFSLRRNHQSPFPPPTLTCPSLSPFPIGCAQLLPCKVPP